MQRVTFKGKTAALDGYISSDGSHGAAASVANPVVVTYHNLGFNQTKALMSIDQEL